MTNKATQLSQNEVERAIFASGCFWGIDHHMRRMPGVIKTEVGYTGGKTNNPTYREVCTGQTGHAEAIEVHFRPSEVSFEQLAILFFETHDPTQVDRQGPDIGTQYRSEIFYLNPAQKETADRLIRVLEEKGDVISTRVTAAAAFWIAEEHHQDYYEKNGQTPHCHVYQRRFESLLKTRA